MTGATLPQETIRRKRDGLALPADEIARFVQGIARGEVGEAQMAAFAMAVRLRGMDRAETVALTEAMRDSGPCLDWRADALGGPVVDKHSTGGVGDSVSLLLGPLLAACGCHVPMISGRGLGHTGGTLDKLESIPGYTVLPEPARMRRVVREAGVAIVGAGSGLVPADQRLYAVRDVTATIDSVPLITASILSKKLAAGLQALVLDVKFGNGAFLPEPDAAEALARSLVAVGCGAGLPTVALLTDMDQPLAPAAGNALELRHVLALLREGSGTVPGSAAAPAACAPADARYREVTLALGSSLLCQAGLAADGAEARRRLARAWDSGAAAERFARMVAGLGGPADLLERPDRHLARAPVVRDVPVPAGARGLAHVTGIDTRALGWAVVALGGGRRQPGERIDPSVGLDGLAPLGPRSDPDAPLATVHAASDAAAEAAVAAVQAAYRLGDAAPTIGPVVLRRIGPDAIPPPSPAAAP
jgi:thymidine phosphorylase